MLVSFIVLLGFAILTSVYGDTLGSVSSFYDDNWDDIRAEIRDKDPYLCVDLTDAECKSRFKSKSQKQIQFLAYGCAGVEAFLVRMITASAADAYADFRFSHCIVVAVAVGVNLVEPPRGPILAQSTRKRRRRSGGRK